MDIKFDAMLLAWYEDSYVTEVPPVCHAGWGPVAWITFVCGHGYFKNLDYYARRARQVHLTSIYWKTLKSKEIV